ncbi:MAG: pseudouridine synthase [Tractidigestivibacter sp.]|jgi:23S rRNA pseudouridine2605 synthase|uniref:pseudouridine synthase n=1 Tax=Tractidigestivibacter sp. TaxID=2847320 RepID=UPI003D919A28
MSDEGNQLYPMRLQRFLARAGVASRRGSERLMTAGRVRVNGEVVTELGSKVDPVRDVVTVDGKVCAIAEKPAYLMLYKPAGYLTTMADPQGRPTVAELVPTGRYPGLFPVGRLDMDTTGLLFFTTNGNVGQDLLHPSKHVEKHYVALVHGTPSAHDLERLRRGVMLEDGPAYPAKAEILSPDDPLFSVVAPHGAGMTGGGEPNAVVGITIHEGRKHQVKKMMLAVGHKVLRLHRDKFGPLTLEGVKEGQWRDLTDEEVKAVEALGKGGRR